MSLQIFPQELLIVVLEQVCHLIVKDLTTLNVKHTECAKFLHQFLQLHLVSRSFHGLLTHYVRVDGKPIRKRLLELQMQKLTTVLELSEIMDNPLKKSTLYRACGYVWKNPLQFNILSDLFDTAQFLSGGAARLFLFYAPKCCRELLTETNYIESGELPSEDNIYEYGDQNADSKAHASTNLANLVCRKTYKSQTQKYCKQPWAGIEFVVERYKFPFTIHWPNCGYWIGTSLSSFKMTTDGFNSRTRQPPYPVGERIVSEEEGQYWLWFIPGKRYFLIDYSKSWLVNSMCCTVSSI